MWRNFKFLRIWQNFTFLHICCVENLKFLNVWWNFRFLHFCHESKSEMSPQDQFFSTFIKVIGVTNTKCGFVFTFCWKVIRGSIGRTFIIYLLILISDCPHNENEPTLKVVLSNQGAAPRQTNCKPNKCIWSRHIHIALYKYIMFCTASLRSIAFYACS